MVKFEANIKPMAKDTKEDKKKLTPERLADANTRLKIDRDEKYLMDIEMDMIAGSQIKMDEIKAKLAEYVKEFELIAGRRNNPNSSDEWIKADRLREAEIVENLDYFAESLESVIHSYPTKAEEAKRLLNKINSIKEFMLLG